jgi:hypothetical protein
MVVERMRADLGDGKPLTLKESKDETTTAKSDTAGTVDDRDPRNIQHDRQVLFWFL